MFQIKLAAKVVKTSDPFAEGEEFVILEIASQDIPKDVHDMLNEFFPNTNVLIEKALTTEAVIASIRSK